MADVLRFFKENEVFVYLILGILAVWQFRKFMLAWDELRSAAFGLERESARIHLNWAASMLVLVFLLAVAEFGVVSFIVPSVPEASPLPTPTLDLLATPTTTLSPGQPAVLVTLAPSTEQENGCLPGQIEITSPQSGETVQDVVEIMGTADIPNFGFYKFEISAANAQSWLTIQAGDVVVQDDRLGYWDTTQLPVGDYALRLVVTDYQGYALPPCGLLVRVDAPSER